MAFLNSESFSENVDSAMRFILSSIEQGGSFGGSTQATILCLKALLLYYDSRSDLTAPATFTLKINSKTIETLDITNGSSKIVFKELTDEKVFLTRNADQGP